MQTSRKQGVFILHTNVPYKMAKGGGYENATEVICWEFTSDTDWIAFDLEQMFRIAMMDVQQRRKPTKIEQLPGKEEKYESELTQYDDAESPTEAEVDEQANILNLQFTMNATVKISELVEVWSNVIEGGLIELEGGGQKMIKTVWDTIHRDDKLRIVFGYISFFVKPFSKLEKMYLEMEKNTEKETSTGNEAQ